LERLQYELELKKLAIERAKTKWTAMSIAVLLMAAVITVVYGLRSMEKQAEMNLQLEAAKAVMQATTATDALDRATFLKAIFPQLLRGVDVSKVDRNGFSADYYKLEFLKLMASRGLTAPQTLAAWNKLFPFDSWTADTKDLIESKPSNPASYAGPAIVWRSEPTDAPHRRTHECRGHRGVVRGAASQSRSAACLPRGAA
jgi:hypothetical protein